MLFPGAEQIMTSNDLKGSAADHTALEEPKLEPPLPPVGFRRLVCHDDQPFEIVPDSLVFPEVPAKLYESVFDFGCGCGRIARQLLCQTPKPLRYTGVDIHRGMVDWCRENLTVIDPNFTFHHHDVWNLGLGPDNTRQRTAPFPVESGSVSLVVAHSVFTHLYKDQTEFYLSEVARIMTDGGMARTTWFLFDRSSFPMLFDFQVSLFINEIDPTNAVIYDWQWFLQLVRSSGLRVSRTIPPSIPGHQWQIFLQKRTSPGDSDEFPGSPEALRMMCAPTVTVQAQTKTAPRPLIGSGKLCFTGDAGEAEFRSRCGELDWWYHSYYFDNGFSVRGDYDIGADVAHYGFPESMAGLRVLDVGTGAGWFAHYFEQLGADVVTVDARDYSDFDVYGRFNNPPMNADRPPDHYDEYGRPVYFSPVSRGFWIMKDLLGSRIRFRHARVYELCPALFDGQMFDLVFMGAILCHLRDPIGALMAARSVCKHRIIASTPIVLGEPESETLPRQYLPYTAVDRISWWLPNEACFRHWFLASGFMAPDISREVTLRADLIRLNGARPANGDQILRVGTAFVP
jgi:SAM-dependent methyltransferase